MRIRLKVLTTELKGLEFETDKDAVTIGRASGNDIVLRHRSVSRTHARIVTSDRSLYLEDLGSKNATEIQGRKVTGRTRLRDGTLVSFGEVMVQLSLPEQEGSSKESDDTPPVQKVAEARPPERQTALVGASSQQPPTLPQQWFEDAEAAPAPAQTEEESPGGEPLWKWLAVVLSVATICLLAAYFVLQAEGKPTPVRDGIGMTVRVGEKKVVKVPKGFVHKPKVEREEILRVERPMNLDRAVLLIGLSEGVTSVDLYNTEGQFIRLHTRVLPGRRSQAGLLPAGDRLSDEQRKSLARRLLQQGDQLRGKMQLYRAMQRYRSAMEVLEPLSRIPGSAYLQAKRRYESAQKEIDERFDRLTAQMGDFIKEGDKKMALQRLAEIRELIPDSEDVRRQNADLLFGMLQAAIEVEKKRE